MRGAVPLLPQYPFMAWYSVQGQLYLYLTRLHISSLRGLFPCGGFPIKFLYAFLISSKHIIPTALHIVYELSPQQY